ncbi:salicylate synthase [Streptomyces alkaliphilus]|uniref:Salicylate synthase n=1 Tax=Streptomyces alkaliphilus TaxID=1472722 RepID=A0A7W3TDT2_9ACTN|nr:salicylate synthase [Streptomyces alkaliphilus]MBB0244928.1 salicylate synthase [Streptomyces alkaliphilus]
MSPTHGYAERRVPAGADPVATVAVLAATATGPHVGYERHGTASWAEGEHISVTVTEGGAALRPGGGKPERWVSGRPMEALDRALSLIDVNGWAAYGWAGFELAHALSGPPHGAADAEGLPELMRLMVPAREIRLDGETALLRSLDPADLDELELRLAAARVRADSWAPTPDPAVAADVDDHGGEAYRTAVARAVADIRSGLLEKVILSRPVPVTRPLDLPATYLVGRRANTPARSFVLRLGGWEVAGFSPEIVAEVTADGVVRTQPLAGTRARHGLADADLALRDELTRDPKEVYEHAVSVRLAADELAGVCAPGTVCVREFMNVKERGSVQHLGSELTGRLAEGRRPWEAFAALFPAVTASGIPKSAAYGLIRDAEPEPRGLYSGAVLAADRDGSIDAALVLRSVYRRDGRTWLRAGAGVVAQSDPEREMEETREKLRGVSRHLVSADGSRKSVASAATRVRGRA